MFASTFTAYLMANETRLPRNVFAAVKREARDRIVARMQDGYGVAPLDFTDLFNRCEAAFQPR